MLQNFVTKNSKIFTSHQILLGDQTKDDETVGACSTYEGEQICVEGSGGKT